MNKYLTYEQLIYLKKLNENDFLKVINCIIKNNAVPANINIKKLIQVLIYDEYSLNEYEINEILFKVKYDTN